MHSLTVTINGNKYEVSIEDPSSSPTVAWVNGERFEAEVSNSAALPEPAGQQPLSQASGSDMVAASMPVAAAPPSGKEQANVVSPMPGKVLAVLVRSGEAVKRGDEVVTLEAMKMAMAVRATSDGNVIEVRVGVGQAVKHGEVLLVVG